MEFSEKQIISLHKMVLPFTPAFLDHWTSLMAHLVKNLPAMQEIWVLSLDQDDALEKGMATHSSILAWRNPWTEEPGGLQSVHGVTNRHD